MLTPIAVTGKGYRGGGDPEVPVPGSAAGAAALITFGYHRRPPARTRAMSHWPAPGVACRPCRRPRWGVLRCFGPFRVQEFYLGTVLKPRFLRGFAAQKLGQKAPKFVFFLAQNGWALQQKELLWSGPAGGSVSLKIYIYIYIILYIRIWALIVWRYDIYVSEYLLTCICNMYAHCKPVAWHAHGAHISITLVLIKLMRKRVWVRHFHPCEQWLGAESDPSSPITGLNFWHNNWQIGILVASVVVFLLLAV